MTSAILNTVLGIISGIFTYILIGSCNSIFKKLILPWYLKKIYRGINLSGTWTAETTRDDRRWSNNLEIKQHAHNLSGYLTSTTIENEKIVNNTLMKFSGEIWEGYLQITIRSTDNKKLSFGSMLLKVSGNNILRGHQLFRNVANDSNPFFIQEIKFERK